MTVLPLIRCCARLSNIFRLQKQPIKNNSMSAEQVGSNIVESNALIKKSKIIGLKKHLVSSNNLHHLQIVGKIII